MKTFKISILVAIISFCLPTASSAQADYYFSLTYSPSLPVGDVANFTGDFSWRGVGIDARFLLNDNVSVGFNTGWNVLREESDGVVSEVIVGENNTATISGKRFRFTNSIPVLITTHYHWGDSDEIRPYIGAGAGLYYINQRVEMGLYAAEEESTRFGISPSAGVMFPAFYNSSLNVGIQYHQAFAANDYNSVGYLAFNIGLTWGP
ncbi:outer membrane beta-barrel protein [Owenweeksia hongkongensis]|uniref:outer membrane beta-barrel protein n=1 Tax=Owenweeksia hongkongensis TaxID=253245 RepID=UPI003A939150